MNNDRLSELDKLTLKDAIFPALLSCVNNRYRIVLGVFLYYAFILNSLKLFEPTMKKEVNLISSVIFTFFVLHNALNYWMNSRDREDIERGGHKCPWIEIIFSIGILLIIWIAHFFFSGKFIQMAGIS